MFNNLILAKGIFSQFRPEAFVSNLKYMLSGMIAIFIVIGVIILATMYSLSVISPFMSVSVCLMYQALLC